MAHTTDTQADEQEVKLPADPYEYIRPKYPTFPAQSVIDSIKAAVPCGRLRFFQLPDEKRAVLLRALNALELAGIQAEIAKYDGQQAKQLFELQAQTAAKCTIWCSFTTSGKLTEQILREATAGLAPTLHTVILDLSDYVDPAVIDQLIIDL